MRSAPALLLVLLSACNAIVNFGELERVNALGPEPGGGADGGSPNGQPEPKEDAGKPSRECDLTKPFGEPVLLPGPINSTSAFESSPSLTDDELIIVFGRIVGTADVSILMASRTSTDEPFGEPTPIPGLSLTLTSHAPTMTGDGLSLFWSEQEIDETDQTINKGEIMTARRPSRSADFGAPAPFRAGSSGPIRTSPFVTRDGSELYFSQFEAPDVIHIYRSVRGELNVYDAPKRVDELASPDGSEGGIAMSADGLTMYFASSRAGSEGPNDVYTAKRKDTSSPWTDITRVPELSSPSSDRPGWLSPDGCRLYMGSERVTNGGIFVASKPPK